MGYYALAHQDSFDVRWIKNGTVTDSLILPLANKLMKDHDLKVLGGCRAGKISLENLQNGEYTAKSISIDMPTGEKQVIEDVDGIVLALGNRGFRGVVSASPDLARIPAFSRATDLSRPSFLNRQQLCFWRPVSRNHRFQYK